MSTHRHLILASGSPRRRELLGSLGYSFSVEAANIDETVFENEGAWDYVLRLASSKSEAVSRKFPDAWVIGADTSVVIDSLVLGKPSSKEEAIGMLNTLSGRVHSVLTAVCVRGTQLWKTVVETRVFFRKLTAQQIEWYVGTGEPMDKAGSYALQGLGALFVDRIEGSPSNVVGLPMAETTDLLIQAGIPLTWNNKIV